MKKLLTPVTLGGLLLVPAAALAHPGHGGLSEGFLHPFTGIDHLMTLLALGVFASQLEARRAVTAVAAFLAAFTGGFLAARAGVLLPAQEPMLAVSLIAMGLLAFGGRQILAPLAFAVIVVFAAYHGSAHGREIDAPAFGAALPGFLAACLVLTGGAYALGRAMARQSQAAAAHYGRAAAALSIAGGLLLLGSM